MEFSIRRLEKSELRHVVERSLETVWNDIPEYERERLNKQRWEKTARAVIEPMVRSRTNSTFVAEERSGRFAGYIVLGETSNVLAPKGCGFIYDLYVEVEFRRRGVASMLLRRAEDFCKLRGMDFLKLEVSANNPSALALYRKRGFSIERHYMGKRV